MAAADFVIKQPENQVDLLPRKWLLKLKPGCGRRQQHSFQAVRK
jgi:hypothetical protein